MSASRKKIDPELLSFGAEVRRLREATGLNQAELAAKVNVTRAYISHVERGRTKCRRDFVVRLDQALKCEDELITAWDDLLEAIKVIRYPRYFVDFPKAEANADQLRVYEAYLVYGLFQTEAYARVLLVDDDAVTARMRRQELLARTPPPTISVAMEESVLYRKIGAAEIMREQLEFLIELSRRERIKIQIAPTAYYESVRGSFTIATQSDRTEVCYMVKAAGAETTRDPSDLAAVSMTMLTLNTEALNVEDSRALIRKVIDERWT